LQQARIARSSKVRIHKGHSMLTGRLLVANRGEIAIRIFRTAAELGLRTVAVYAEDDADSLHITKADEAVALPGRGAAAYLDRTALLAVARATGAKAVHPGYGFLSENPEFARACESAGLVFIGPTTDNLALFGNKQTARDIARREDVPVLAGTSAPTTLEDARGFLNELGNGGSAMIKAVAGGGGRGMREVHDGAQLEELMARCQSEASKAFGNGEVYLEQLVRHARHVEVQVVGDGRNVVHLWDRECTLQRRNQKLIEMAPALDLPEALRERILSAATTLATAARYRNLGTIEFLVDTSTDAFYFIEANPRLQVEHTVTEAVTGLDLVELQLRLGFGASLGSLGLSEEWIPPARGRAMQMRINAEVMTASGDVKPDGEMLTAFAPPSGRGVRVDAAGYRGYRTNPAFDTLLAKLIVHTDSSALPVLIDKGYRALCEFDIAGAGTNISLLQNLLTSDAVRNAEVDTKYVEAHSEALTKVHEGRHPHLYFKTATNDSTAARGAGAKIDGTDPLAVLDFGQQDASALSGGADQAPLEEGLVAVNAPLQGTLITLDVTPGQQVARGAKLAVFEAMKMEHILSAETAGVVHSIDTQTGETLWEGQRVMTLAPAEQDAVTETAETAVDLDHIRDDLGEILARRALTRDDQRPQAVARRRKTEQRTVWENVNDLVDADTFVEYGPLTLAAQRRRRELGDLITRSPADGLITGVGRVNGDRFDDPHARTAVMAYDYTVFAGTQGVHNHWKTDRILDVAERGRMPFVLFGEGGGGRPGESDYGGFVGQNTFQHFGKLSGHVPMVGIVSGRCFAGNAALMGCCDVIIATANTNIGMGGPAMVEGGGLGVFAPEDIGPMRDQVPNGVVDIAVAHEREAVQVAKQYLGYFQGRLRDWEAPDQRLMRSLIPENRLRVYEIRDVINTLADIGSVLELRAGFGRTMVTAFIRVEGQPVGILANDPKHLGGAIDSDGADKSARFMQLCDAFDIPLLNLCDTPGIMVGPEVEKTALVRHAARMFLVGNNLDVPFFTVVLRKAYGLGAIAMAGGNFRAPYYTVSWPTGEFGPMGLEGQVKLGFRAELAAIEDAQERREYFEKLVGQSYEEGKALARSNSFTIDDTIDPTETRYWLSNLLASIRTGPPRRGKKRPMIDAW
jgi:acetyl/propionyl-CoA carboxylase alpha subunit/acetyl-CoA carboxylase carboxyltransferase component